MPVASVLLLQSWVIWYKTATHPNAKYKHKTARHFSAVYVATTWNAVFVPTLLKLMQAGE